MSAAGATPTAAGTTPAGCPGPAVSCPARGSRTTAARPTRASWPRSADPAREAELVAAVAAARLLVPIVAAPGEVDTVRRRSRSRSPPTWRW